MRLFFAIVLSLIVGSSVAQIEVVLQTGNKGKVTHLQFHPSEPYLISSDENHTVCVWNIQQKKQFNSLRLENSVSDITFLNDSVVMLTQGRNLLSWNFKSKDKVVVIEMEKTVQSIQLVNGRLFILSDAFYELLSGSNEPIKMADFPVSQAIDFSISNDQTLVAFALSDRVEVYDLKTKEKKFTFSTVAVDLDLSNSEKRLAVVTDASSVQLFNLETGKKFKEIASHRKWKPFTHVVFGGEKAAVGNEDDVLQLYNLNSGRLEKNVKNKTGTVSALAYQSKSSLLATAGELGRIHVYDFATSSKIQTYESLSPNITQIVPIDKGSTFLIGYENGEIKKWNFKSHQVQTIFPQASFIDRLVEPQYEVIRLSKEQAVIRKYWNSQLSEDKVKEKFYSYRWNENFELLSVNKEEQISQSPDDFQQKDSLLVVEGQEWLLPEQGKVTAVAFDPSMPLTLVGMNTGFLYAFDRESKAFLLQCFSSDELGFFYITPEDYYFASKNALESIGARYEGMLLDFKQLDTRYNRPDKVLEALPFFSDEYITLLRKARNKRLSKLGIEENQAFDPAQLPQMTSNFGELPLFTDRFELDVKLIASTSGQQLKALHIAINGVPQFGLNGLEIKGEQYNWEGKLMLTPGLNKIEAYVETTSGYESLREIAEITLNVKSQPDLYVLSIGSGTFEAENFNLKYAEKDAAEFAQLMEGNKSFEKVHVQTITGKDVTRQSVYAALEQLNTTDREDVVMILFAGHGLLDYKLDYYLSTYDMNFNDPAEKGISMLEFEEKLAVLNSQNKILLLDACHSGELDKDEVVSINDVVSTDEEDIQFRSGLKSVGLEGSESVFELSKNIFADLRKNNGVITISSAGSDEYALEGGQWNNGAFTYAILDGLSNGKADLNGDKKVTSNELSRYLFETVPELTEGKQTPTSRVENLYKNITLW